MNRAIILSILLATPLACFAQASMEPLDLAGFSPGQSPRAAASAFAQKKLPWTLAEPLDASLSDALANDCLKTKPSPFWVCKALFFGAPFGEEAKPSPRVELTLSYDAPTGPTGLRSLVQAHLFAQFNAPQADGWPDFLAARRAPRSKGPLSTTEAKKIFAARNLQIPSEAKSFHGAFWIYPSASGEACELSALAALDAKGALLALLAENSFGKSNLSLRAKIGMIPAAPSP